MPSFVRRRRLPEPQLVNGTPETWSIGYLTDVILTRDPWMHRLDLARATGQAPVLTADHDGVIVADAVLEWARRRGQPYRLELTGPPAEAGAPVRAVRKSPWTPPTSAESSPAAPAWTPTRLQGCSPPLPF